MVAGHEPLMTAIEWQNVNAFYTRCLGRCILAYLPFFPAHCRARGCVVVGFETELHQFVVVYTYSPWHYYCVR